MRVSAWWLLLKRNGKFHFSVKVNSNYQFVFGNTLNILLSRSTLLHE